jgi:hypothetical protein
MLYNIRHQATTPHALLQPTLLNGHIKISPSKWAGFNTALILYNVK